MSKKAKKPRKAKALVEVISTRKAGPQLKIELHYRDTLIKDDAVARFYVDGYRVSDLTYHRIIQTLQLGSLERLA